MMETNQWKASQPGVWRSLLVLTVASIAGACAQQHSTVGDGTLIDLGWASHYPRYRVHLGDIELTAERSYAFYLSGLPQADYSVHLVVAREGKPIDDPTTWRQTWEMLDRAKVSIGFRVTGGGEDESDLNFAGPLTTAWSPAAWGEERYYQSDALRDFPLRNQTKVSIEVRVEDPGELNVPLSIQPRLVAGGFET